MSTSPRSRASASPEDKPLPHNKEAEQAILGSVLLDNAALATAVMHVHSGDFFHAINEKIFRRMVAMAEAQQQIDLIALVDAMQAIGQPFSAEETAYLAGLADGLPKVTNVEHYANIVAEKARLRSIIHKTHAIQQQAFEGVDTAEEVLSEFKHFYDSGSSNGHGTNRLVAVDLREFLLMKLDPVEFIIEPILPVSNSAMIFAPTGAGKTYIMLYMAYCVSIGRPECFVWNVPEKRRVTYVDGEMDSPTLQERMQEIARGFLDEGIPDAGYFKLITPDLQKKFPPRINTKEGRARIEEHVTEGGLLVLDNLQTLCPGGDEKETEDWAVTQEWILHLRRKRVSVFLVQHAGKSGDQLGTSKKEIQLSCNLMLRTASDYMPEEGLRVEVRIKKLRRRGKDNRFEARWAQPFEIVLRVEAGAAEFSQRPMLELLRKKAVQMLLAGMRENDVAQETGLNRFQIYRINKKIKAEGQAAAEAAE